MISTPSVLPRAGGAPAALRGWPLTATATLTTAALCAVAWGGAGAGLAGWSAVIRTSAKTSLACFLAAFVASSARVFWRSRFSAWLLANRRYLGVSFATSHAIHLFAIVLVAIFDPAFSTSPVTLLAGGFGYVLLFAMAATSFDGAAAWMGPPRWKRLHKTGMYYLWGIFLVSYLPRALGQSAWYWVPTGALLAAIALRGAAWRHQLRR